MCSILFVIIVRSISMLSQPSYESMRIRCKDYILQGNCRQILQELLAHCRNKYIISYVFILVKSQHCHVFDCIYTDTNGKERYAFMKYRCSFSIIFLSLFLSLYNGVRSFIHSFIHSFYLFSNIRNRTVSSTQKTCNKELIN